MRCVLHARRWCAAIMCSVGVLAQGCLGPVPANRARSAKTASDRPVRPVAPAEDDPTATAPVDRLTVNTETVEASALWKGYHDELAAQAQSLSPADFQAYVERRAAQLIADKIPEMLLHARASLRLTESMNEGIDKYVDGEIRRIVATQYDGVQRRYERHLESNGMTLDDMIAKLRREVVITSHLEAEVRPKVAEPTRAELLATYDADAPSFRRPARRRMSLIDVRPATQLPEEAGGAASALTSASTSPEAARAEARSRIKTAKAELDRGADFADVARRHSVGLHADEGGAWGWVTQGSVRERFEPAIAALYQLAPGDVSDILETDDGFFLVRCDEVDAGYEPDFQSLQRELFERQFREAYNREIMRTVGELRAKASIEPRNLDRFHAAVVAAAPGRESLLGR